MHHDRKQLTEEFVLTYGSRKWQSRHGRVGRVSMAARYTHGGRSRKQNDDICWSRESKLELGWSFKLSKRAPNDKDIVHLKQLHFLIGSLTAPWTGNQSLKYLSQLRSFSTKSTKALIPINTSTIEFVYLMFRRYWGSGAGEVVRSRGPGHLLWNSML